ncbi:MAG: NAD(P)/FAD-dependent oxidoreductase [Eubacteriales bacterium]
MDNVFDLIVIGTGSGASTAARKCSGAGWKVAVIDERPFGGTCALRGCDMKKILMGAAELVDWNIRMNGKGIDGKASITWSDLMAFKRSFIDNYSHRFEKGFTDAGIDTFHGSARFAAEDQIEVNGQTLRGDHILIATGARPMPLSINGEENVVFSDYFLDMDTLPRNIVFIGGGMISLEFAHVAARAGSTVTIIERQDRPLMNFDADLVSLLMQKSNDIGIRFIGNTIVHSVEKEGGKFIIKGNTGEGEILLSCDLVVHGAGRIPDIEKLNLAAGNVDFSKHGITVNEYMQSVSNPKVYSAGDAADTKGLPLTPIASMESTIASINLLKGNAVKPDYSVMPSVVFTVPSIASVGLSEEKAREAGYECYTKKFDISGWYTYKRTNEKYAMAKIVIDRKSNCIIGAHFISNEADELVNHFATAIQLQIDLKQLKRIMFAYPTTASDIVYML